MQTQKMNLANIKGKLSRAEMKNIMAGSGGGGCRADGEYCDGAAVPPQCCHKCGIITSGPDSGKEKCYY